jgi:RimJ/RimL family protein N-acetyltransferase
MPAFSLQPVLETATVRLLPLQADDFKALYAVAADPKIWEQHPNKDRWQEQAFTTFFEGALQSKGAFKIVDKATGATLGSTRFTTITPRTRASSSATRSTEHGFGELASITLSRPCCSITRFPLWRRCAFTLELPKLPSKR